MSGAVGFPKLLPSLAAGDGLRLVVTLACDGDSLAAAEVLARATRHDPAPGRDAVLRVLSQFGHAVHADAADAAALARQLEAVTRARRLGSFEWLQAGGLPPCPIERGRSLLRVFGPWLAMRGHALVAFPASTNLWLAVAVRGEALDAFASACDRLAWGRTDPTLLYAERAAAQSGVQRQLDDIMRTLERHAATGWRRLVVEAVRWPEDYAQGLVSRETEADCWIEPRRGPLQPLALPDAGWASLALAQLRRAMLDSDGRDGEPHGDWRRLRLQRRAGHAAVEVEVDPQGTLRTPLRLPVRRR